MMSKGFITTANLQRKPTDDFEFTDLQIIDQQLSNANDEDIAIEIFVNENGSTLNFTLPEAKALTEAMQHIINRYEEKLKIASANVD